DVFYARLRRWVREVVPAGSAEQNVLWTVEAQLEKAIPELFRPDYSELLTAARTALADPEDS
ncbi:MAG: hypothetical protein MK135_12765, partial [Polyangiaceae bacterium]|nr:hypothetical protein [Polyangiaceae bacterium]